jgi:hypothetical protein
LGRESLSEQQPIFSDFVSSMALKLDSIPVVTIAPADRSDSDVLITRNLGGPISTAIFTYIELDSDSGESKGNKALIASDCCIFTDSEFLETSGGDDDDGGGSDGDEPSVRPKVRSPLDNVFDFPDTDEAHATFEGSTSSSLIFSNNSSDHSAGVAGVCKTGPGSIRDVENIESLADDDFHCIE